MRLVHASMQLAPPREPGEQLRPADEAKIREHAGRALALLGVSLRVPGHRDVVVVVMVCGSCSHEWSDERPSLAAWSRPAEGDSQ